MRNPLDFKIRGHVNGMGYPCVMDIKYDGTPVLVTTIVDLDFPTISFEDGTSSLFKHDIWLRARDINPRSHVPAKAQFLAEWIAKDGKNGTLYDLQKGPNTIKIFDIHTLAWHNGAEKAWSEAARLVTRKSLLERLVKPEFLATSITVASKEEMIKRADEFIKEGYEGVILKNQMERLNEQRWVKVKYEKTEDLVVVRVEASRFEVMRSGVVIGVKKNFDVKIGDTVEVKHNGVQDSGSLRNPIATKIIKEA